MCAKTLDNQFRVFFRIVTKTVQWCILLAQPVTTCKPPLLEFGLYTAFKRDVNTPHRSHLTTINVTLYYRSIFSCFMLILWFLKL